MSRAVPSAYLLHSGRKTSLLHFHSILERLCEFYAPISTGTTHDSNSIDFYTIPHQLLRDKPEEASRRLQWTPHVSTTSERRASSTELIPETTVQRFSSQDRQGPVSGVLHVDHHGSEQEGDDRSGLVSGVETMPRRLRADEGGIDPGTSARNLPQGQRITGVVRPGQVRSHCPVW